MKNTLRMYAIFDSPRDFPGFFVVRGWTIGEGILVPDDKETAKVSTIEEAREAIPDGLVQIEKSPFDDPAMAEVWI
jgi:hypothetical protein